MKLKYKLNNTTTMDDWPKHNMDKLFTGLIEATTRLEDTQKERLEQEKAFNTILMVMEETLTKLDQATLKRDDVNTQQLNRVLRALDESLKGSRTVMKCAIRPTPPMPSLMLKRLDISEV
jgi:predicted RNA-binding Zn ribbon-like protein